MIKLLIVCAVLIYSLTGYYAAENITLYRIYKLSSADIVHNINNYNAEFEILKSNTSEISLVSTLNSRLPVAAVYPLNDTYAYTMFNLVLMREYQYVYTKHTNLTNVVFYSTNAARLWYVICWLEEFAAAVGMFAFIAYVLL